MNVTTATSGKEKQQNGNIHDRFPRMSLLIGGG